MEKVVKLNTQTAGRDKTARLLQYLSRIVWYKLQQDGKSGDTFKNVEFQLGSFRKLLRFGKCVDTIYSILPLLNHNDSTIKITVILGKLSNSMFLLADHILWLDVPAGQLYDISNYHQELEVILFLHQRWTDSRLGVNSETKRLAVAEKIWKPKITFINGRLRNMENREDFIFWRGFGSEGNVILSEKYILSTFCTTKYKYFPFDQQVCQLKFGSYRFPKYDVELYWIEEPVEIANSLKVEEFKFLNLTTYPTTENRPTGAFSVLIIELTFQRYSLHYILCTGFPSTLVIFISYVTQFLKKEDRLIRCAINMSCLVALLVLRNYDLIIVFPEINSTETIGGVYARAVRPTLDSIDLSSKRQAIN
ncbi:hypothetical protein Trydic_g4355 [Trypoxylus dichotomus]